jgi:DNA (cytosine-5)-methyltransferase 3A
MNRKWTIVSVFDGMACGALALQAAGIEIESYDAFEIDKYAIQTAQHNFPFIKHHGDVFKADFTQFKGVDLLMAGFPCTKFSIAQKNDRETQPYQGEGWDLFWQAYRAINEAKPRYFLLENNKSMAKAVREEISRLIGFDPVLINSALVSAQNRQRLYWVGKRNPDGTYSKVNVEQPADRGILLKDILEGNEPVGTTKDGKTNVLTTVQKDNNVAEPVALQNRIAEDIDKLIGLCSDNEEIVQNCKDIKGLLGLDCYELDPQSVEKHGGFTSTRLGRIVAGDKGKHHDSQQYRVYSTEGKSVTLCSSPGSLGKMTGLYAVPIEFDGDIPIKAISAADGKTYTVYEVKDGKITIKGKQYDIKLADGYYIIRKLTVKECMRLQTVPEWYEFPVSDSQAYKMLGNGWTVDVIAHLLESILREE